MSSTPAGRGVVIIPAHNEAAVIERTLRSLSSLAGAGTIELIVACNGCTDNTVEVAAAVPGTRVLDLRAASKTAALNAADGATDRWPRLYLDADIEIVPSAVLAVLDRLSDRSERAIPLAARPARRYDLTGVSLAVRCYYRVRTRIRALDDHLWGAGAYAVGEAGHSRFGRFAEVTADDLWIDRQFDRSEIAVVDCVPVAVRPPRSAKVLLATLTRVYSGNRSVGPNGAGGTGERVAGERGDGGSTIGLRTVLATACSPRSLGEALVYCGFAVAGRILSRRRRRRWARDETSRQLNNPGLTGSAPALAIGEHTSPAESVGSTR